MKDFIGKYALSKTLRFELKPVGETAERLEDFKNQALKTIVTQDKQRADEYKQIKEILNKYHRDFIDTMLSESILSAEEIITAFDCYLKATAPSAEKQAKDAYGRVQDTLRASIAKVFEEGKKDFMLFDAKLFNEQGTGKNKHKPVLWHWLRNRLDRGLIGQEEFEEGEKLIKSFNRFSTYFVGFNQNLKNIYSKEAHPTAVGYRVVHENMERHFSNCLRFERIKKKYPNLAEILSGYQHLFTPPAFLDCLPQTGIDAYNEAIGHKSDDINAKGINQHINEYRQKNKLKPRDLPTMAVLYKQILSDREDGFAIDEFNDDKSVLTAVRECYSEIYDSGVLGAVQKCLSDYLQADGLETVYIKNDAGLTDISQKLWDDWGLIDRAIQKYAAEKQNLKAAQIEKLSKEPVFSLSFVQSAIDHYFDSPEQAGDRKSLTEYFVGFSAGGTMLSERTAAAYDQAKEVLALDALSPDRRIPDNALKDGGEGFQQIEKIKNLLDSILDIQRFLRPLYMLKSGKMIEVGEKNSDFYDTFNPLYEQLSGVIALYNKVRNYVTKKPYKTEKFKINFENSTLLAGWDVNKETANTSVLLFKSGRYFLGVMRPQANNIFNYIIEPDDSANKQKAKEQLRRKVIADGSDDYYEKMVYKLLPDPAKMLSKVFFSKKNLKLFAPSQEILDIREKGLYKKEAQDPKALKKWIDFMVASLAKHPEWNRYFNFDFRKLSDYADISEFYNDVAEQGYSLTFDKIKADYINEKISSGDLHLFEIYSKDFSTFSKGRPNLHTSYWKLLFSKENLDDVVLKLNGEAEIFFRPASLNKKKQVIHKAKEAIGNKNLLNPKKQSTFDYDIIKDRRFTRDKFFFHCPITLNFKRGSFGRFNDKVNDYLVRHPETNIIGIDRGERHLLYYSVINPQAKILEQGSLNTVSNTFKSNGKNVEIDTDYHRLLNSKEKERDKARKSWSSIENIKELKSGYLSHIVHKLATLMVQHNAVICLEDLNFGFKRGRFKVEKQIYQKFEKALIDKLNYLVFKDKAPGQPGHYLKAYQLTAPFESFQKLGKQNGFLFYVTSDYTSKIDPVSGFVNRLDTRYKSVDKSREFLMKFDGIRFNGRRDYFEFAFDYAKFPPDRSGKKKQWTVCTHGKERYRYNGKDKKMECFDVTEKLKKLFMGCGIDYSSGQDLRDRINAQSDKGFFSELLFCLSLTLQLRHSCKIGDEEKDFILSPVADNNGRFFDSREYENIDKPPLPKDADANGAYNIARKGILTLRNIRDTGKPQVIKNTDWFDFVQNPS